MATNMPQLGYGDQDPGKIDQVNQWMRSQPWYTQFLASIGQDPSRVQLSDDQKAELVKIAQANGVVVDQGHNGQEIDDSGNFKPAGNSVWKDIGIGAGIGALGLTGLGAFGIGPLAGVLGAGGAAADAGATAAEAGSAAGDVGAFVGPTAAELGGVPESVLAGAAPAASAGGSTISGISKLLGSKGLGGIGSAIGKAETAAGGNRLDQEKLGLEANQQNISGQSAYENELLARAKLEEQQRQQSLKDLYRASYAQNPRTSPYDPAGPPKYSAAYMQGLSDLEKQGLSMLDQNPQYNTSSMTPLAPYKPINPADVQGATNTKPGTLSKIGQWLGPGMSTIGEIANMFGG